LPEFLFYLQQTPQLYPFEEIGAVRLGRKPEIRNTESSRCNWKLLPAVVEPNGRLKDKVRGGEKTEVHTEGTYYIAWWEEGKRKRKAVPYRRRRTDSATKISIGLAARYFEGPLYGIIVSEAH
jgi:hypothetical protein